MYQLLDFYFNALKNVLAKITQLKLSQKGLKRMQKSFHKNYKNKLPSTADECVESNFIPVPNQTSTSFSAIIGTQQLHQTKKDIEQE